jgi:glycosyltransferase involved in cell wall biosynthesis
VNKLPISVCVISGAEEHRIGTCLRSAAQWTSEIVVVLNEEVQDGTEEIAKSFGAKVVRHPWEGFREQKNLVLTHATQPWILALDCAVKVEGASTTLPGDLLHYSNPNISSYVSKINYFADVHLQRQLAEGARWSAASAVFRSAWRFARAYFLRRGFLDGYPGFFIAASTAYSTLVRHSRLFEHGQPTKPVCEPAKSP